MTNVHVTTPIRQRFEMQTAILFQEKGPGNLPHPASNQLRCKEMNPHALVWDLEPPLAARSPEVNSQRLASPLTWFPCRFPRARHAVSHASNFRTFHCILRAVPFDPLTLTTPPPASAPIYYLCGGLCPLPPGLACWEREHVDNGALVER